MFGKRKRYEYEFFAARDQLSDNVLSLNNLGSQGWKFVQFLPGVKQPKTNSLYNSTFLVERESRW